MLIYDGVSDISWIYTGKVMTARQMMDDPETRGIFDGPAVLMDDGSGNIYSWVKLSDMCAMYAVPCIGNPEEILETCMAAAKGAYKAPGVAEAQQTADEAKATADEAKDAAAQAGTDPQLQALAALQVQTMDLAPLPASELATFRDYWPEWQPDHDYKQNDPLRHKGVYYRVSQDTTSSSVYPPDTAGESLYYPVTIAPDGIIVYRPCHGEYDMVRKGETRHYPDAEGPVYRAKVDTAYDPDTVPANWELVQE